MSYFEYLPVIKAHYERLTPIILEVSSKYPARWVKPYCHEINWLNIMSPIEEAAWMAIRSYGRVPLYPQYPVGKYFLDFGNPVLKIGIECDGKAYHIDKAKDFQRDTDLFNLGWTIYRISGVDCFRYYSELEYIMQHEDLDRKKRTLKEYYETTIEGLIRSIFLIYMTDEIWDDEYGETEIAKNVLEKRISVDYDKDDDMQRRSN